MKRFNARSSAAVVAGLAALGALAAGFGSTRAHAAAAAAPQNTQAPTLSGSPVVGATLTATNGTWTGSNLSFTYRFLRCGKNGGSCYAGGTTTQNTYKVTSGDAGNTIRVRVIATNSGGSTSALSAPTALITDHASTGTGCPSGTGVIQAAQLSAPAQLTIDRQDVSPAVIGRSTQQLQVRFHVSACNGRDVQGSLVYVTAVPFQQFTIPAEAATGSDGWASLPMTRLQGFPTAAHQQLLVLFVRARQPGTNVLTGLSSRRLVSFRVDLSQ